MLVIVVNHFMVGWFGLVSQFASWQTMKIFQNTSGSKAAEMDRYYFTNYFISHIEKACFATLSALLLLCCSANQIQELDLTVKHICH